MLEVTDVKTGYGHAKVLHGVSLKVREGELVALLGSNGAGKSTLNNNISGIYKPFAGSIRFDGAEIAGTSAEEIVDRGLIQVPEGRRVFPNMSVRENLELGSYRRATPNRARNIDRVVEIFPRLKERFDQYAGTLSGGEQQMLAIGRGLMAEPRLLILDEPSLGLSPLLVEEMFALIQKLRAEGLAIFLVEQNVVQSLEVADRAYVMENGLITVEGPAQDLMHDEELRRSYLGM
ncbi:ABC transporter ATP-binding protein [Nisaea nitritireducens]|uniref:ABC transporter ATP-binding protein n=1 Tax=Nisaea nitritireducens TaxID=568392 RepID=UPI0018687AF5|nr:ABC transporter ATP-binding protein [Nisaea nitritireducens]